MMGGWRQMAAAALLASALGAAAQETPTPAPKTAEAAYAYLMEAEGYPQFLTRDYMAALDVIGAAPETVLPFLKRDLTGTDKESERHRRSAAIYRRLPSEALKLEVAREAAASIPMGEPNPYLGYLAYAGDESDAARLRAHAMASPYGLPPGVALAAKAGERPAILRELRALAKIKPGPWMRHVQDVLDADPGKDGADKDAPGKTDPNQKSPDQIEQQGQD